MGRGQIRRDREINGSGVHTRKTRRINKKKVKKESELPSTSRKLM